tara:strand:+ start:5500 stop:6204 length:705 start_codon:yes stop_codon:yes gene_type:complete
MSLIEQNWSNLITRIDSVADKSGRSGKDIQVVAVSKTRSSEEIQAAQRCGLSIVGENRVQEAERKKSSTACFLIWHMIGRVQSNKAGRVVELFDMVQSVDKKSLADTLNRRAAAIGRRLDILVQINTSGLSHQVGVLPDSAVELVCQIAEESKFLNVRGLMTIAPYSNNEGLIRESFTKVRRLSEEIGPLTSRKATMDYLSMGMSADFEWAIEEGSNMVRLGTAIFGERPPTGT